MCFLEVLFKTKSVFSYTYIIAWFCLFNVIFKISLYVESSPKIQCIRFGDIEENSYNCVFQVIIHDCLLQCDSVSCSSLGLENDIENGKYRGISTELALNQWTQPI